MDERTVARFWAKVDRRSDDECWHWTGWGVQENYGVFSVDGRRTYAHRFSYAIHSGPIALGLHVDHECHNADLTCKGGPKCPHRRCVNPSHLAVKSSRENTQSSPVAVPTHCKRGHEFTPENTRVWVRNGYPRRHCRACHRERAYKYRRIAALSRA